MSGFQLRANRELLGIAFSIFRRLHSAAALTKGPAVVAVEPAFAQTYALYLSSLAEHDQVHETSDRIVDVLSRFRGYTPHWVQAWLITPLQAPGARLNAEAKEWLRGLLDSDAPSLLRARAALALAIHREIEVPELAALFNVLPSVAAPDVVAALAFLLPPQTDPRVRSVVESEHLYRWVFEYASSHASDCRWA
jgi:hypothetical protein